MSVAQLTHAEINSAVCESTTCAGCGNGWQLAQAARNDLSVQAVRIDFGYAQDIHILAGVLAQTVSAIYENFAQSARITCAICENMLPTCASSNSCTAAEIDNL